VRLEFVGVAGQRLEIGDPVVARTGAEDVVEGEGGEGGIAAGAAPADHQPIGVGASEGNEMARAFDAVPNIDDAPPAVKAVAIGPPIAAAAAIVHIE
jgi:hypothetical protein